MRKTAITLLLPLMVFIVLAGHQLGLPGLHNDEAQEAGLPALQIVSGVPVTSFRNVGLGPRQYPLMVQDYIGAINVYLVAPFVAVLGPSVVSVRLPSLLLGVATVITSFGFASAVWNRRTALVAVVLMAINPSFVFWSRQGILIASLTLTLTVVLMWVGFHWAKHGGWRWTLSAGFLAGLGIYSKLLFVWVVLGMTATVVVFNLPLLWRRAWNVWPRWPTLLEVSAAAVGILVGLLPLLAYNLISGGTFLAEREAVIWNENGAIGNLVGRLDHLRAVLTGRNHLWYLGGSSANMLWESTLVLSCLVILIVAAVGRPGSRSGIALLLTLFFGLLQFPFTPTVSGPFPHHFAVFAPLWIMLVAVAFDSGLLALRFGARGTQGSNLISMLSVVRHLGTRPFQVGHLHDICAVIGRASLSLGLLALIVRDIQVDMFYHTVLRQSGGEGPYSGAIYRLVDELEARNASTVVALDWGFAPQLRYLTGERIIPHEIFGYTHEVDQGFASRLEPLLETPGAVFVAHWPSETFFPRRNAFDQKAADEGFHVKRQGIVSRRTGAPMFELLAVTRN